ncbi:hypothetical protein GOP47_0026434 [Adiantum capillus-veneris]|nr:hypothetical protein GOP47_0026434 [Adiantum capillus-veneris]
MEVKRVTLESEEGFEFVMEPEAAALLLRSLLQQAQGNERRSYGAVERIRVPQLSCEVVEQLCCMLFAAYLHLLDF